MGIVRILLIIWFIGWILSIIYTCYSFMKQRLGKIGGFVDVALILVVCMFWIVIVPVCMVFEVSSMYKYGLHKDE